MNELEVIPPATRGEIVRELENVHHASISLYATLSAAAFVAPQGAAWSPGDHVRHLTKSMRALNRGLRFPRLVIRWKFGAAQRPSRDYAAIMSAYRTRLETFDGRNNPFAPVASTPADPVAWREEVLRFHEIAVQELARNVMRFSETQLDKYQLPHPLLGKLTMREMFFFMVYHNLHYARLVASRLDLENRD